MSQLLSAILAVLGGQRIFPADLLRENHQTVLTAKEQQILALLVRGFSNLQIGAQLHSSSLALNLLIKLTESLLKKLGTYGTYSF